MVDQFPNFSVLVCDRKWNMILQFVIVSRNHCVE